MGTATNQISTETNAITKGWNFSTSNRCVVFKDLGIEYLSGNLCSQSDITFTKNPIDPIQSTKNGYYIKHIGTCNMSNYNSTPKHISFQDMTIQLISLTNYVNQVNLQSGYLYIGLGFKSNTTISEGEYTSIPSFDFATELYRYHDVEESGHDHIPNEDYAHLININFENASGDGTVNVYLIIYITGVRSSYFPLMYHLKFLHINTGNELTSLPGKYFSSVKAIKYSDVPTV